MKVWCYFLKSDKNTLYAFTTDKEMKNLFEEQRLMKNFIYGKREMPKSVYQAFSYTNRNKMLTYEVLTDGDRTFQIACTPVESSNLSESCEYISDFLTVLKYDAHTLLLKPKYLNFISEITEILMYDKSEISSLNINTFKIFTYLYKETFFENSSNEESFVPEFKKNMIARIKSEFSGIWNE